MKHLAAMAIGATLLSPLAVQAGGPVEVAPEPMIIPETAVAVPLTADWNGFYGGAALGYGDIDSTGNALNGDGALGGVFAGYRMDFGNWVGGIEADYDTSSIDLGNGAGELESIARLKLQAGAKFSRALVYATAGAAHAKADVGASSLSDTGYFGGVGVDYALTDNWVVGGEALLHKFDDFDNSGVDFDPATIKARVAYKF